MAQPLLAHQSQALENAADARYLPTGHLVFLRLGTLFAVRFDPAALEVRGEPVAMALSVVQALSVRPDGQVFYGVQTIPPPPTAPVTHIQLVQNWAAELTAKLPPGR